MGSGRSKAEKLQDDIVTLNRAVDHHPNTPLPVRTGVAQVNESSSKAYLAFKEYQKKAAKVARHQEKRLRELEGQAKVYEQEIVSLKDLIAVLRENIAQVHQEKLYQLEREEQIKRRTADYVLDTSKFPVPPETPSPILSEQKDTFDQLTLSSSSEEEFSIHKKLEGNISEPVKKEKKTKTSKQTRILV
jgi:uncharacterized coiled-coil protein SlyX